MKKRRLEQRTLSNNFGGEKALLRSLSPGSFQISLEYRINKKDEVNFKLFTGKISAKVKRNLKEFFQIEEHLQRYLEKNMPEM